MSSMSKLGEGLIGASSPSVAGPRQGIVLGVYQVSNSHLNSKHCDMIVKGYFRKSRAVSVLSSSLEQVQEENSNSRQPFHAYTMCPV